MLRSVKSKAYFILQLGYFKAKHMFFVFELPEVEKDLQFILKIYFMNANINDLSSVDKLTRFKQQHLILDLFNYRNCDSEIRQQLESKAYAAVSVSGKPIFIFREA